MQVVDTMLKKVMNAPHAKKVKRCFGQYTTTNIIEATTSMTVSVPGDVAINFLKPFSDKGSKNIFRSSMYPEDIQQWLPGGAGVVDANLSANSRAKAIKDGGQFALGTVTVKEVAVKYTYDTTVLEVTFKSQPADMLLW